MLTAEQHLFLSDLVFLCRIILTSRLHDDEKDISEMLLPTGRYRGISLDLLH